MPNGEIDGYMITLTQYQNTEVILEDTVSKTEYNISNDTLG